MSEILLPSEGRARAIAAEYLDGIIGELVLSPDRIIIIEELLTAAVYDGILIGEHHRRTNSATYCIRKPNDKFNMEEI